MINEVIIEGLVLNKDIETDDKLNILVKSKECLVNVCCVGRWFDYGSQLTHNQMIRIFGRLANYKDDDHIIIKAIHMETDTTFHI